MNPYFSIFVAVFGLVPAADALTITVNTQVDQFDNPSGPQLSLREAVRDAVAGDVIGFTAGMSELDFLLLDVYGGSLDMDGKSLQVDAPAY